MSEHDAREQEIAQLRQMLALALAAGMADIEASVRAKLSAAEAQLPGAPSGANTGQTGGVNAQGIRADHIGSIIGRDSIVNNFFGGRPGDDGEQLLRAYLQSVAERCRKLHLARISGQQRSGNDQRVVPTLGLDQLYVNLRTDAPERVAAKLRTRTKQRAGAVLQRLDGWRDFDARTDATTSADDVRAIKLRFDAVRDAVITPVSVVLRDGLNDEHTSFDLPDGYGRSDIDPQQAFDDLGDDAPLTFGLLRPELAIDAIAGCRRLVLLGEPGGGKSTVLRHLALLLAKRLLGEPVLLPFWPADDLIPIYLPLGKVARAMRMGKLDASAALLAALGETLDAGSSGAELRAGLRVHLASAIRDGGVILLLDGLDELPADGVRGAVAQAIRRLGEDARSRIVVTSRVRPYARSAAWQLTNADGWSQRTLQPLRFGQVRAFVQGWYAGIAAQDPELDDADARANDLIAQLNAFEPIRRMVDTPLLLTMVALLHYNKEQVPRDKVRLFEELVKLLLERWEPKRTPEHDEQQSVFERIGLPKLDIAPIRIKLQELAYAAHQQPPLDDGRGLIETERFNDAFTALFARLGVADAAAITTRLAEALIDETGLLVDLGDGTYAFPHLQLEEYLAACHLAALPEAKLHTTAYAHWSSGAWDRWSDVLQLLVGCLRDENKVAGALEPWLQWLSGTQFKRGTGWVNKPPSQRRRDALLAALAYSDNGVRDLLPGVLATDDQTRLETKLNRAIHDMLAVAEPGIGATDRIVAARVLADLGDERFPVTDAQWRAEHFDATFTKEGTHYWRAVPRGNYRIGGWEEDQLDTLLPLESFWVARFPVTVAQYAAFVNVGYAPEAERFWTSEGWKWKKARTEPYYWGEERFKTLNQPVIGMNWYKATAFCAWMTERLSSFLPPGYVIRLPSEAEWEVAAAYAGPEQRRDYPWGDSPEPTPELAVYDWYTRENRPAPIGTSIAGAAACGAQDMAGNVWEWTATRSTDYPTNANTRRADMVLSERYISEESFTIRGGSTWNNSTYVRCGARASGIIPSTGIVSRGLRLFVAPRSLIHADF